MFNIILASVMFLIVAVAVIYVSYCFASAPDMVLAKSSLNLDDPPEYRPATWWDKLIYSTHKSSTLFIQFMTTLGVLMVNGLGFLAELAGFPEMRIVIEQNLSPQLASWGFLGLVILTTWARFRKE